MTNVPLSRRQATASIAAVLATLTIARSVAAATGETLAATLSNIDVVRAFMRDFFNAHDPSTAERFCTEDYVFEAGSLGRLEGPRRYADGLAGLFQALPDVRATEQSYLEGGDMVAVRYAVEGAHLGPLWGIAPTGRPVRWETNIFYRIRDGRMAHQWAIEDWAGVFQQLGMFKPPYAA